MASPLEQLPPEILEQIVTPVHRRAREISRTLRAATQRRLEQLCRSPIYPNEFYYNLLEAEPVSLIFFPKLDDVLTSITQQDISTINIDTYYPQTGNSFGHRCKYSTVKVFRDSEHVGLEANFRLIYPRPSETDDINDEWVVTRELDVLTQWRILVLRAGCPDVETMTRNYLVAKVEQMRQFVIDISSEWFAQDDDRIKSDAVFLVLYFYIYLFLNAQLLNVWPLRPDRHHEYLLWMFDRTNFGQDELEFLWTDIDIFYPRVIRAIQRLETM